MRVDVLIFGGGAAGLWCLDRFRRAGYAAVLLESAALGRGQTIQAQGIIHGGGKYALHRVRDYAAVRSTRDMPERWRRSLAGALEPHLTRTRVLSDRCYLWLPRGSALGWMQSWGFVPLLARTGLLATPPQPVEAGAWPIALERSALAVYSLAEPVIATGSLLENLAERHRGYIYRYAKSHLRFTSEGVEVGEALFRSGCVVLAAGEGNGDLLARAGVEGELMQRRPLGMVLLRGELSPLFGHCVVGGKTDLTITTPVPGVWQIGGEIAERLAGTADPHAARRSAIDQIRRRFPELDFSRVEIALYSAVRAEARTAERRRPSGVHVSWARPRLLVAWPTKLSLAPVLAEEVFALAASELKEPAGEGQVRLPPDSFPPLARYPWEEVEWYPAR